MRHSRRVLILVGVFVLLGACTPTETGVGSTTESSADVASQLECLPLDPTGWARSDPLPLAQYPWAVSLAANEENAVVMGLALDMAGWSSDDVLVYWSDNGIDWRRVEGFPSVERLSQNPPTMDGDVQGFVAVVNTPRLQGGEGQSQPLVAFSPDGRTWKQVDPDSLPASKVLWVTDVQAGPGGFIMEGNMDTASGDFAWYSPDGTTWTPSELPDLAFGPAIFAIDSGWAALGIAHANFERPSGASSYDDYLDLPAQVWTSSDGINWSQVETSQSPLAIVAAGYMGTPPLAVYGDLWVAAPEFHEHGNPSVWVSADQGRTWNDHPLGGEFTEYEHNAFDMHVTPAGLVLTGRHDFGQDDANMLHYSLDGRDWRHCGTDPIRTPSTLTSSAFTEVETLGDTIILYDNHTGTIHTWTDPDTDP